MEEARLRDDDEPWEWLVRELQDLGRGNGTLLGGGEAGARPGGRWRREARQWSRRLVSTMLSTVPPGPAARRYRSMRRTESAPSCPSRRGTSRAIRRAAARAGWSTAPRLVPGDGVAAYMLKRARDGRASPWAWRAQIGGAGPSLRAEVSGCRLAVHWLAETPARVLTVTDGDRDGR